MRLRRMFFLVLSGALFAAMVAPTAGAVTAYTLDGQIGPVTYTGGSVTLDPVSSGGPDPVLNALNLNIDCLDGVCDIVTQDWVLFEVSVVSGSVGQVGLTLLDTFLSGGLNALGLGYLLGDGPGPIQDGSGGTDLYTGTIGDPDLPVFSFEANGGGAGITGTSLVLFVAYADGSLPHTPSQFPGGDGAVSFMVEQFGGAGAGSGQGNFTTAIDVIPEPTTGLLMGLGLALLGARRRR